MKRKICVVIPDLYIGGGAEKVAFRLTSILSKDLSKLINYEFYFFTLHNYREEIQVEKKYSLNQSSNSFLKLLLIPYNSHKLYLYLKKKNIDIVISHMERSNSIAILCRLLFKKSLNVFCVNHNYKYISSIFGKYFSKSLYPHAKKIICVSKQSAEVLKSYNLKNINTIYNPFPSDKILKLGMGENLDKLFKRELENKKNVIFLNIGRLHKQKGQIYLIKIFSQVVKQCPNAKLFIFGEGELKSSLEQLIFTLRLQNNVYLMGNTRNVFQYLSKSDYFLLTSLWEGLPTVLIEALHFKNLQIFSTDCKSGPREVLLPSAKLNSKLKFPYKTKFGYLFDSFKTNDKENLDYQIKIFAKKIIDSINSKKKERVDSKEFIDNNFNEEVIARKWIKLLEN